MDGQNIDYTGSLLSPSLDKFKLKMVFHVKADNSANGGKASFGSDAVRPILNLRGDPIPYFLSGTLKFDLLDGTTLKGTGTSDLDLASGEISTRPSGPVQSALSALL